MIFTVIFNSVLLRIFLKNLLHSLVFFQIEQMTTIFSCQQKVPISFLISKGCVRPLDINRNKYNREKKYCNPKKGKRGNKWGHNCDSLKAVLEGKESFSVPSNSLLNRIILIFS